MTTTTTSGRLNCRYRRCGRYVALKRAGSTSTRKEFCNDTCRRSERMLRERPTRVLKGYPTTNLKSRKHTPGDTFGDLVLIEYRGEGKGGSQGLFSPVKYPAPWTGADALTWPLGRACSRGDRAD